MDRLYHEQLVRLVADVIPIVEDPSDMHIAVNFGGWDPSLEEKVKLYWKKKESQAKEQGKNIFNGKQLEFIKCHKCSDAQSILLELRETDYVHYIASLEGNIGPEVWLVGNSGAVIFRSPSGERQYVFGDRQNVSDVGGTLELPPAGFIDISKPRIFAFDIFAGYSMVFDNNIKDELEEEIGFDFNSPNVKRIQTVGIVKIPRYRHVNVNHVIEMDTSEEEVMDVFADRKRKAEASGKKHELSRLYVVPESKLLDFLKEQGKELGPRAKSHLDHVLRYADIVSQD